MSMSVTDRHTQSQTRLHNSVTELDTATAHWRRNAANAHLAANTYRNHRCKRHRLSPAPTDPGPSNPSDPGPSMLVSSATPRPPMAPRNREEAQGELPTRLSNNSTSCAAPGCTTAPRVRGICRKHGNKRCRQPGCTTAALSSGLCTRHGGRRCIMPGCTANTYRNKRCKQHTLSPSPIGPGPSNLSDPGPSTAVSPAKPRHPTTDPGPSIADFPATSQPPVVTHDVEQARYEMTTQRHTQIAHEQL